MLASRESARDMRHVPPAAVEAARTIVDHNEGERFRSAPESFYSCFHHFAFETNSFTRGHFSDFSKSPAILMPSRRVQQQIQHAGNSKLLQQTGALRSHAAQVGYWTVRF
jgi:hypothetical protein